MKKIEIKIDLAWDLNKQYRDEAEKYFGKNFWGLTISRCSEQDFKSWWEKNKDLEYKSYYYELAQYVWDQYEENLSQIP